MFVIPYGMDLIPAVSCMNVGPSSVGHSMLRTFSKLATGEVKQSGLHLYFLRCSVDSS